VNFARSVLFSIESVALYTREEGAFNALYRCPHQIHTNMRKHHTHKKRTHSVLPNIFALEKKKKNKEMQTGPSTTTAGIELE
jgi:hypothetical protein